MEQQKVRAAKAQAGVIEKRIAKWQRRLQRETRAQREKHRPQLLKAKGGVAAVVQQQHQEDRKLLACEMEVWHIPGSLPPASSQCSSAQAWTFTQGRLGVLG